MKRVLRIFGKPLLALVATGLMLAAGEAVVRVIGVTPVVIPVGISKPDDVCIRSSNPILSYEWKPNYRNTAADGMQSFAYTNAHGQRDVERSVAKPDGVRRILLLGDSVVAGHGIQEIDDLMSRQLERLFPPGAVEVLNLGVSGYCTRAEVELLKVRGLQFDPDLVILVFVENDFINFQREARYIEGRYDRSLWVRGLFQNSDLFRLACLKFNLFGYGLETNPAFWNQQAVGDNNVDEGLRLLRELAEREGFEVLIAAWPFFDKSDIKYSETMLMPGQPEELLVERLARMHGLRTVGLVDGYRTRWHALSPQPNPNKFYTIGDHLHPSAEGHRVAAEILNELIESEHLLEPNSSPRTLTMPAKTPDRPALEAALQRGLEKSDYSALHLNVGRELVAQGKLDEALDEFAETLRLNPNRYGAVANYEMGVALRKLGGDLSRAAEHLAEAVRLEPEDSEFQITYGLTLSQLGQLDEAIAAFERAVEMEPEFSDIAFNLGALLKSAGRLDEAANQYARAVQLSPGDADFRNNLGNVLRLQGKYVEAAVQLGEALQLNPDSARANYNLALTLVELERFEEALAHAQTALEQAQAQDLSELAVEIEDWLARMQQK